MGRSIRGSNTEKNVALAFANESMTVNRYSIFSRHAFKEGLNQAGEVFCSCLGRRKKTCRNPVRFLRGRHG